MAYFKISEPNQPTKWIKEVDNANTKLTFQNEREGAYYQDEGFFADSELDYLKHHFTKDYPELEYMTIDCEWGDCEEEGDAPMDMAGVDAADEPMPMDLVGAPAAVGPAAPIQADLAWND